MIKEHPSTHEHEGFKLRYGHPLPFGASEVSGGVNFSIYSANATSCVLVLFNRGAAEPFVEIPFPEEFQIGDVFAMIVFDIDPETIEYGYRFDGPMPTGTANRFDPTNILLDPLARSIAGRETWMKEADPNEIYQNRGRIVRREFD